MAFATYPAAAQEVHPAPGEAESPDVAALNTKASTVMAGLGRAILKQVAPAQRRIKHRDKWVQNVSSNFVAPGVVGVEIDYSARRSKTQAGLGTYTVSAAFATSSRNKINVNNLIDVNVNQNAGGGAHYTSLEICKTDSGYNFLGQYGLDDNKVELHASTIADTEHQQLDVAGLQAAGQQMTRIVKRAPTKQPITGQLKPVFAPDPNLIPAMSVCMPDQAG